MQEGYDVCRLRIEFEDGEFPWLYPLALNGRVIKAMFADGEPVERVVRCRDCQHAFKVTWPNQSKVPPGYLDCQGELVETWDYYADEPKCNPVPPDGYCAWGERKEGE